MDDGGSGLVVFLLGDPHLLERGQRSQNGSTDPDRVLALRRGDDFDLHRRRGQRRDLLLHPVGDASVHGGASGQHRVGVQILADVDVALHDRVVGRLVDTNRFHSEERGLEQRFGAAESLVADCDHLSVGQFVRLLQRSRRTGLGHFLFKVEGDIAQLLLDVTNDFPLGCLFQMVRKYHCYSVGRKYAKHTGGGEGVTTFGQDLHQVIGKITAGQIQTENCVRKSITYFIQLFQFIVSN